ncbi:hypothetical protein ACLGIH_12795 [Streptomyces sp. HMX87]|uniref:hypothetical protein n=1 Tax=Streptomyces sp. HMX87 TaxID=3390849 RepID=UPI003A847B2C
MNTFLLGKRHTGVLAGISMLTAVAMLSAASPALAGTEDDAASGAASIVERATGTADLAPTTAAPGGAGRAVISTGSGDLTVDAPTDSSGYLESTAADGTSLRLDLPETNTVTGVRSGAGTIVYAEAARSTDLAIQPTVDGGARTLVTLKDGNAPEEYRFGLDLPAGTGLLPDGQGGYLISKSAGQGTAVLGSIDAPWAKDARGEAVPTAYRVEGDTLVQTVTTNASTVFPVVADPKVSFGFSVYFKFSKAEVKALNNKVQYADTAAAACGLLVIPAAAVGCAGITTAVIRRIQRVWQYAKDNKRCVELSFSYAGLFSNVKHYKC